MDKRIPDLILDKIWLIDKQVLDSLGAKALILDVDNTLSDHGAPKPREGIVQWLCAMKELGVPMLIVSNNMRKRVEPFANSLGLPYMCFAVKPLPASFRAAAKRLGAKPKNVCVVGDQIFTDILGGNMAGMKTVLVMPFEEKEDPFVKFKRKFEKRYIDRYYKRKGEQA